MKFLKKLKRLYRSLIVFIFFLPFNIILAGDIVTKRLPETQRLQNPLKGIGNIRQFLTALLDAVVFIAFPFIILMVIYSGFLFVSAQGNEEKLKIAKRTIFWTIVGALIILGASMLSYAIEGTVDNLKRGAPAPTPSKSIFI
ncbi:hypothetical protein A2Z61_01635 [Candidatus Campbellbacteria bacterium RIFCSPLOWO2_02_35_12]|uniref:Uncharacterized protein n=1 Tax=Candidatus Campbellbacteria bacterium RIFCSPLOWO2_02_35_12 TaxID=1797580 RepID=A0A1F5EG05_9BACT|nr:MAG: hypothetical protein A2Z61_01635 [Candidatus Campbellbacteria bacterium RIFCSPLOWO2_02_35_12]